MLAGVRTCEEDLVAALDLIDAAEYDGALSLLARVTSFQPGNAIAYELWVGCHIRLGRLEKAIELADQGIERGLPAVIFNVQKSNALRELGRFEEAMQAATVALTSEPESSDAMRALAAVEIARGAHEAAIEVYQRFLARNPDDEVVHFELVELLRDVKDPQRVIESAQAYLRRFGKDAEVLAMMGHAYVDAGDLRRADRAFRDAADLEPDDVEHHVNVLALSLLSGKAAAYDRYLDQLERYDPELAAAAAEEADLIIEGALEADDESL